MKENTKINHTIDKEHGDFQLLKDIFRITSIYNAFSTSCGKTIERHYIREYNFRYWDTADGDVKLKAIQRDIEEFNERSTQYEMHFVDTTDYEMDHDNDRDWPANWTCGFKKK